jgi:hypothetical protein
MWHFFSQGGRSGGDSQQRFDEKLCTCGHSRYMHAALIYYCEDPDCTCEKWADPPKETKADEEDED